MEERGSGAIAWVAQRSLSSLVVSHSAVPGELWRCLAREEEEEGRRQKMSNNEEDERISKDKAAIIETDADKRRKSGTSSQVSSV